MRLWHYLLVPYLPTAQLKAMRYEIGDMVKQYPNIKNGLAKYANNYDCIYLSTLFFIILDEFEIRAINHNEKYDSKILNIVKEKSIFYNKSLLGGTFASTRKIHYSEHNDRYLKECLYNLEEKATRNIISKDEWTIIYNHFKDFTDLWDGEK